MYIFAKCLGRHVDLVGDSLKVHKSPYCGADKSIICEGFGVTSM